MSGNIPTNRQLYLNLVPDRHFGNKVNPVEWVMFRTAAGESITYMEHMTEVEAISFAAEYGEPMPETEAALLFSKKNIVNIGPDEDRYAFVRLPQELAWSEELEIYIKSDDLDRFNRERAAQRHTSKSLRPAA